MSENIIQKLSEATGLSRADMDVTFQKVKANSKTLKECQGPHAFERQPNANPFRTKYICSKCKGEISSTDFRWYEMGLKHGGKP